MKKRTKKLMFGEMMMDDDKHTYTDSDGVVKELTMGCLKCSFPNQTYREGNRISTPWCSACGAQTTVLTKLSASSPKFKRDEISDKDRLIAKFANAF